VSGRAELLRRFGEYCFDQSKSESILGGAQGYSIANPTTTHRLLDEPRRRRIAGITNAPMQIGG
jgi:hypothetical protein